jgi:hypothetical protein
MEVIAMAKKNEKTGSGLEWEREREPDRQVHVRLRGEMHRILRKLAVHSDFSIQDWIEEQVYRGLREGFFGKDEAALCMLTPKEEAILRETGEGGETVKTKSKKR